MTRFEISNVFISQLTTGIELIALSKRKTISCVEITKYITDIEIKVYNFTFRHRILPLAKTKNARFRFY